MQTYKRFLTIAGSDSGGGAGIQADIKTASAQGCYAASVITSVTSQNTKGVNGVFVLPPDVVESQLDAVLSDIGFDAVKLGMLPTAEIVEVVARLLRKYDVRNIVLDPVMVATSGDRLISEEAVGAIVNELFPIATLITPNIPELEFLTALSITAETNYNQAAQKMLETGIGAILIKSGHIVKNEVADYLYVRGSITPEKIYPYRKIETKNTHGTGCTLSSAIASSLAFGFSLADSVERAEQYIHGAIAAGADYEIGEGHGPVNHFFKYWEK